MTLTEWLDTYEYPNPKRVEGRRTYAVLIDLVPNQFATIDLYHLSDFSVASVEAGVYWMVRK